MAINRVLIGHLNINTIRSKFDVLSSMAKDNIDISLIVSEKKLGSYFPSAQIVIEGYALPFRYDRSCHGGGILIFIRQDISSRVISTTPSKDLEGFLVEVIFCKKNFFFCAAPVLHL